MKAALAIASLLVVALAGPAVAAADVPHEQRWQRAAGIARFPATPAPGDLAGFILGSGRDGLRPIDGYYDTFEPGDRDCRRLKNRVKHRFTTGHFWNNPEAEYGAVLTMHYQGLDDRRACWPQTTPEPASVRFVRHVEVLGKRMKLYWNPDADVGSYYFIEGRLRGNRFYLHIKYDGQADDPSEAEIVRIAHGMRWVRR